jgi:hypothetical protein
MENRARSRGSLYVRAFLTPTNLSENGAADLNSSLFASDISTLRE